MALYQFSPSHERRSRKDALSIGAVENEEQSRTMLPAPEASGACRQSRHQIGSASAPHPNRACREANIGNARPSCPYRDSTPPRTPCRGHRLPLLWPAITGLGVPSGNVEKIQLRVVSGRIFTNHRRRQPLASTGIFIGLSSLANPGSPLAWAQVVQKCHCTAFAAVSRITRFGKVPGTSARCQSRPPTPDDHTVVFNDLVFR